ncbi:MAG TPA: NUDIX domain-containing protein [Devosia sp.]|nr:NUDIX domain-containing protein [Devosia sp.]
MSDRVTVKSITPLARGWGRLDRYEVDHIRQDGTRQTVLREVYDHGSAAAVLMFAPAQRTIILTRQFRLAPHLNGDPAWLIEAPAGLLDAGEAPDVAARREAIEETGYEPEAMQFLFNAYMSAGSLTEKCACFLGRYTPGHRLADGGGLVGEGEDIEVFELGLDEALAMVATGSIMDAKTILMLQALQLRLAGGAF